MLWSSSGNHFVCKSSGAIDGEHFNVHANIASIPNEHSNKVQANILFFCQHHHKHTHTYTQICRKKYICINVIQQKVGRQRCCRYYFFFFLLHQIYAVKYHRIDWRWVCEYFIDFTYLNFWTSFTQSFIFISFHSAWITSIAKSIQKWTNLFVHA